MRYPYTQTVEQEQSSHRLNKQVSLKGYVDQKKPKDQRAQWLKHW